MVGRFLSIPLSHVISFILVSFPILVSASVLPEKYAGQKSPVILVPGDGGSQLEAKLDKPSTVHYFCSKKTDDYFTLWLNLELLVPYVLDCWVDNMRLVYDNVTRTTSNSPGVQIRIPGFGSTSTVEWLDPSQISPGAYFYNIVELLVKEGYTRDKNIKGAPFDYRKAPNEMTEYFNALKTLTEDTYHQNQQTKATFICHSMGCPVMSYFFSQQAQTWKNKYVKALISLSGAWGGAVKALKAYAAGYNLDVFVISGTTVREEQRTCPSLAYVMPSDALWRKDEVLVMTETKNYSLSNMYDFFKDINFPDGYEMYKDTYSYAKAGLNPPGVEVHCLYGMNITNTIEKLYFKNKKFPDDPSFIFGNGDGTVNDRSLEACLLWQGKQDQNIYHVPVYNVDHMGILSNSLVLNYIKKVLQQY